ncbi:MAG: hypothetical protein M1814_001976 [Vezdaea aestivalis]|nr:MAG: hypothetical protein M1814_001976 [Vezdaea aestivalis]
MSTNTRSVGPSVAAPQGKSPFEQQRDALVSEIAVSLEHVLQNINKLNRSLEGIIAVGNEFYSVEALWSQFETVMGKAPDLDEDKNSNNIDLDESNVDDPETALTDDSRL